MEMTYNINETKNVRRSTTNMYVFLENKLLPGDSLQLDIDWEFNIPRKRWVRMGNYGNDRLFIAYWYPQIAVYDDVDGWDRIEYLGTVEFYNDFNNYNVTIETPPGFTVWATGELRKTLTNYTLEKVVENYNKTKKSDNVINIFSFSDTKIIRYLKAMKLINGILLQIMFLILHLVFQNIQIGMVLL